MEQSGKSGRIVAVVAILVMLGAVGWGVYNSRLNTSLEAERDQEKLKVESLLSQKLMVEKDLRNSETKLKDFNAKNETLARRFAEAQNAIDLREGTIKQLQRHLAANRKSYADLSAKNREIESRLASLNQELQQLQEERLAAAREADGLRNQIDHLKSELALAHNAYYDKVLVETSRGKKDKLIVKASRTRKLKASVMIPSGLKEIQFQVFDPAGKLISNPDQGVLAVKIHDDVNAVASTSNGSAPAFKQAEMTFLPKHKLSAGVYRIEVLSENLSVGSLQLKLR